MVVEDVFGIENFVSLDMLDVLLLLQMYFEMVLGELLSFLLVYWWYCSVVEFEHYDDIRRVMRELDDTKFQGRRIYLKEVKNSFWMFQTLILHLHSSNHSSLAKSPYHIKAYFYYFKDLRLWLAHKVQTVAFCGFFRIICLFIRIKRRHWLE